MIANQKLRDGENKQVALFPLPYINVSQADDGTYSHDGGIEYWATDYLGWSSSGRVYRANCYAPVDLECIYLDRGECMAVWQSLEKVHLANDTIDYLGVIVYHDNDITNNITQVGTIKRQGEVFNKTGTGGNVTGDHVHLETGYGRWVNPHSSTARGTAEYKYHFTDYTTVKRLHNYDALFRNDTIVYNSPAYYDWKQYQGRIYSKGNKFKWVLYARKLRYRRRIWF